MMSKKQWTVLLCLFLIYLLMGAGFFYNIERAEENIRIQEQNLEKIEIYDLLEKHYKPSKDISQDDILNKLTVYCGRPVDNSTESPTPIWDFYHSFFFAFTVVSTIGYGNLAPTTMCSRMLMIFYALIGIPINGILLATLGDFFSKKFIKIHEKWKSYKKANNYMEIWKFGLCGQIALYLIPGFIFFIFLPAYVIMIFEDWDYDVAVYYAFVTLTTIGFGDYVAGMKESDEKSELYILYEIFLIIWIVFGLGYLVMVLGFITRGMRSKRMARLEHKLACNIKSTQSKIWHGFTKDINTLRRVLNEIYMLRFKPIYRDEFNYIPTLRERSCSCPDLSIYRTESSLSKRRRAFSESVHSIDERDIGRVQSDTDLERIDRQATFAGGSGTLVEPCELLAHVVSVLGTKTDSYSGGIHGFSDNEILASEWTIGGEKIDPIKKNRSYSEYKIPTVIPAKNEVEWTWSGPFATKELQEIRRQTAILPAQTNKPKKLLNRIKKPFLRSEKVHQPTEKLKIAPEQYPNWTNEDEKYHTNPYMTHPCGNILEETSVADLLRAITKITGSGESGNSSPPRRKYGTASLTPPKLPSLLTLFPPQITPKSRRDSLKPSGSRRMSLRPPSSTGSARSSRRFSVRPVDLPNYHVANEKPSTLNRLQIPAVARVRSYSLHPTSSAGASARRLQMTMQQRSDLNSLNDNNS